MSLFLVILAAGESKRLNSTVPKPFCIVNGKTILEHSLESFNKFPIIKKKILVYNKKHKRYLNKIKLSNIVKISGGSTRQESTFKALKKINGMNCKKILIHDSARPNPSPKLIAKLIKRLKNNHIVVPVIKATDATKRVSGNVVFKNIERKSLRFAQTPQGFTFNKLFKQHSENKNKKIDDDSSLFVNTKEKVLLIPGNNKNLKITNNEDLNIFKSFKKTKMYYGIGFDIHRLVKKRKLYLGGIKIPFHLGLKGHSDGDPVIHAIIDSLLGACKLGDIGKLFSDKNKKNKNIRSTIMLKTVVNLLKSNNFVINNIDINIIAQKPKIKKYEKKINKLISKICLMDSNQINIKGKTTEKLGLIGKEQAIASEVIASVIKNYD
jgi:2-C-methyl-D-erythritol 4-phosphate cytidylyltransferase / 2-C-methyl-D-erythritol 2,4-cyclodiphosphate synthase